MHAHLKIYTETKLSEVFSFAHEHDLIVKIIFVFFFKSDVKIIVGIECGNLNIFFVTGKSNEYTFEGYSYIHIR